MNIQQKKTNLINWIEGIDDEAIIQQIQSIKSILTAQKDWWNDVPESHKISIRKGLQDVEDGNVISLEAFRKLYAHKL